MSDIYKNKEECKIKTIKEIIWLKIIYSIFRKQRNKSEGRRFK